NLERKTMYKALVSKDHKFEGLFWAAIKTTGIFCRPTCKARKPKEENVEYFTTTKEALYRGYRPCKMCKPMLAQGEEPDYVKKMMNEINAKEKFRFKDYEIKKLGINPNRLRRWFKENHAMTFQAYLRAL